MHRLFFVIAALLMPVGALAASGETLSGATIPPPTVEERIALLQHHLGNRPLLSHDVLAPDPRKALGYRTEIQRLRGRKWESIPDCRDELRRANRDSVFPVTLRCFRGLLVQDLTMLRKRETYVAELTGISDAVRESALTAVRDLTDAVVTVANAIDTGVYERPEDLIDVKQRLTLQYRIADWQADLLLRIDRHRAWLAQLLHRLELLRSRNAREDQLTAALDCLEERSDTIDGLDASRSDSLKETANALVVYERSLAPCLLPIRAAAKDRLAAIQENN